MESEGIRSEWLWYGCGGMKELSSLGTKNTIQILLIVHQFNEIGK
jgi:hypothetical protein